jgi:hypothetical protein
VIFGLGIGYHVDFGYFFASGEYRYYGNRGHDIGALSEVAHGNDAVAVLLNGSNGSLVRVNKDNVGDSGDSMAEGGVAAVVTMSVGKINLDTNLEYYDQHALNGSGLTVSARRFTIKLGPGVCHR